MQSLQRCEVPGDLAPSWPPGAQGPGNTSEKSGETLTPLSAPRGLSLRHEELEIQFLYPKAVPSSQKDENEVEPARVTGEPRLLIMTM